MNGFTYASIAVAVIAVVAMVYWAWQYWHTSPADRAKDAVMAHELRAHSQLGPHAAAQDASWVNRETHGNMG
jgi:hypothetical protein